jgi:hypothetical protein
LIKIVFMLVWMGGVKGGPTVVSGFATLESCEAARYVVMHEATELAPAMVFGDSVRTKCIEVPR